MIGDPRGPMTPEEVEDLLKAELQGPLPQNTVYRMMATLGVWMSLPEQLDKALSVLSFRRRPDDDSAPYPLERELERILRLFKEARAFNTEMCARCKDAICDNDGHLHCKPRRDLEKARADLAANAKVLAQQNDLARQAELEREEALARLKKLDDAGTGYSQQTMDAVTQERDKMERAYHAEFDKREAIRAWWHEHVRVEGDQLTTTHEELEELRELIADWSFDEAVELRSKDRKVERLEIELEQARAELFTVNTAFDRVAVAHGKLENRLQQALEAADDCRLRTAEKGQYECPAFPYKNQAGGG